MLTFKSKYESYLYFWQQVIGVAEEGVVAGVGPGRGRAPAAAALVPGPGPATETGTAAVAATARPDRPVADHQSPRGVVPVLVRVVDLAQASAAP